MKTIEILPFDTIYSQAFYHLNIEWLKTYFYVEPFDEEVLSHPKKYIIDKGGHIFFVKYGDTIVGTAALMTTENASVFELTKMAISPNLRGQKIGHKLLQYCINFAKTQDFEALILYSARKLENAIHIYRKFGFTELQLEKNSPYKRSDIKMELKL